MVAQEEEESLKEAKEDDSLVLRVARRLRQLEGQVRGKESKVSVEFEVLFVLRGSLFQGKTRNGSAQETLTSISGN